MSSTKIGRTGTARSWAYLEQRPVLESLVVASLVLAACEFGIHTRFLLSLASIWPANAVLLGTLLIRPSANRPLTWLLAALAYGIADTLSGSDLSATVLLNLTNMVGVAAGLITARLLFYGLVTIKQPMDAIALVTIMALASIGAGISGAFSSIVLFDMDWITGFGVWFASEFVSYAIVLPVVLAINGTDPQRFRVFSRNPAMARQQIACLSTLILSLLLAHLLGGPGAGAYMLPGMLWCAICFRPLTSTILAMLVCTWALIAGPLEMIPLHIDFSHLGDASSFRLSIAMTAVGTFAVSVVCAAWRQTNAILSHTASHDTLTGLLNRGAFMQLLERRVAGRDRAGAFSLLMLDIDRFKTTNDTYGHPMGDKVLVAVAAALREEIGPDEGIGRLGGEEFAVLASGNLAERGAVLAERLRKVAANVMLLADTGERVTTTVSIGAADGVPGDELSRLLSAADSALYAAKHAGRDRVVLTARPLDPRNAPTPAAKPQPQAPRRQRRSA